MFGLGTGEIVLIFLVALIFFGPKKLPEMGKSLGRLIRAFRTGMNEIDLKSFQRDENPPQPPPHAGAHPEKPSGVQPRTEERASAEHPKNEDDPQNPSHGGHGRGDGA